MLAICGNIRRYDTRPNMEQLSGLDATFINLETRKPIRIPTEVHSDFVVVVDGKVD